jgi:hypothetical protein
MTPATLIKSLAILTGLTVSAYALSFDLNTLTPSAPISGNTPGGVEYKADASPAAESGDSAWIAALTSNISGLTADVSWSPAGSIDLETIYLKAGNQYVSWDVSGIDWSLYSGFHVTNSWIRNPNGRTHPLLGISHLSLTGDRHPPHMVPDSGATVGLLGLGLAGLGFIARRRRMAR